MHDPTAVVCDAPDCEYSYTAYNKPEALVLSTLHQLDKHPIQYQKDTGKIPDISRFNYREYLDAYRGKY